MVVGGGEVGRVVGYTPAAPPFVILVVLTRSAADSSPSPGRNRESSVSSCSLSFSLSLSLVSNFRDLACSFSLQTSKSVHLTDPPPRENKSLHSRNDDDIIAGGS